MNQQAQHSSRPCALLSRLTGNATWHETLHIICLKGQQDSPKLSNLCTSQPYQEQVVATVRSNISVIKLVLTRLTAVSQQTSLSLSPLSCLPLRPPLLLRVCRPANKCQSAVINTLHCQQRTSSSEDTSQGSTTKASKSTTASTVK